LLTQSALHCCQLTRNVTSFREGSLICLNRRYPLRTALRAEASLWKKHSPLHALPHLPLPVWKLPPQQTLCKFPGTAPHLPHHTSAPPFSSHHHNRTTTVSPHVEEHLGTGHVTAPCNTGSFFFFGILFPPSPRTPPLHWFDPFWAGGSPLNFPPQSSLWGVHVRCVAS
jgi:hypothetical protein